ncbi:MAG TPA: SCO family protein [Burkholderiales bacterium]|jgi:protein SCO1/2|nr:SCO family protein [Burkholderiales bacterium]
MEQLVGRRTARVALISVLALGLGIIAAVAGFNPGPGPKTQFTANDITGARWARSLELTDHTGRRRTLADFRGKVVLVFFGYTNCPDACPTALAEMAQVVRQLGPAGDEVQGLFITVDPERDTPEKLASYVPAFRSSFLGLRGSMSEIREVASEFKIYFQAQKARAREHSSHGADHGSYMVDHSTGIYAFDRQGQVRLYFSANSRTVETMVNDIKVLLRQ